MTGVIYLDAAASAPLEPRVLTAVIEALRMEPANPSASHGPGRRAHERVEHAREQVAALTGAGTAGVVFTSSGATEANALALRGLESEAGRSTIVSCATEHPSVLSQLDVARRAGRSVRMAEVDRHGEVDLDALRAMVGQDTLLVSVMAANNETGVLTDLAAVAAMAHEVGALVHTDASQLLAWGPIDPSWALTWSRSVATRCTVRRVLVRWLPTARHVGSCVRCFLGVGRSGACVAAPTTLPASLVSGSRRSSRPRTDLPPRRASVACATCCTSSSTRGCRLACSTATHSVGCRTC